MKVYLSVDMEGTTGLERTEEIFRGLPGYDTFRQVMAGDANAVIQGLVQGGTDEVVVSDSHGYMCNIHPDDLMPGVRLRRGQLRRATGQMKGLDGSFDAVVMIGYHAKAGTKDGILSHTWGSGFRDVRINGISMPETSLNGLLAGALGVPVIMVGGDDRVAEESVSVLGDIHYAQVKKSLARNKGSHLPVDRSRHLLRDTARRAMGSVGKVSALRCDLPVTVEVDLSSDPLKDPPRAGRPHDNLSFIDGSAADGRKDLSDVDLILLSHPHVTSPKSGTIQFTCNDFVVAYQTLFSILGEIYERDIENVIDVVADPSGYERPDLEDILGRDYLLTEIPSRRQKPAKRFP